MAHSLNHDRTSDVVKTVVLALVARAVPEDAVAVARRAEQTHGDDEDDAADGARLTLQEESGQVQHHENHMIVQQGRVHRLRDQKLEQGKMQLI